MDLVVHAAHPAHVRHTTSASRRAWMSFTTRYIKPAFTSGRMLASTQPYCSALPRGSRSNREFACCSAQPNGQRPNLSCTRYSWTKRMVWTGRRSANATWSMPRPSRSWSNGAAMSLLSAAGPSPSGLSVPLASPGFRPIRLHRRPPPKTRVVSAFGLAALSRNCSGTEARGSLECKPT